AVKFFATQFGKPQFGASGGELGDKCASEIIPARAAQKAPGSAADNEDIPQSIRRNTQALNGEASVEGRTDSDEKIDPVHFPVDIHLEQVGRRVRIIGPSHRGNSGNAVKNIGSR